MTTQQTPGTETIIELTGGKHPCACSDNCPALTGRTFAQGHDARMVTRLRNAVMAEEMTPRDAFSELQKRGGLDGLYFKLQRAIDNAHAKAAKKGRKGKKAKQAPESIATWDICGYRVRETPTETREARAKVGRWSYEGQIASHQVIGEEGVPGHEFLEIFSYEDRKGNCLDTATFAEIEENTPAEADDRLPIPVSLRGDAAAEAAREEVAETFATIPAEVVADPADDTSDIPF